MLWFAGLDILPFLWISSWPFKADSSTPRQQDATAENYMAVHIRKLPESSTEKVGRAILHGRSVEISPNQPATSLALLSNTATCPLGRGMRARADTVRVTGARYGFQHVPEDLGGSVDNRNPYVPTYPQSRLGCAACTAATGSREWGWASWYDHGNSPSVRSRAGWATADAGASRVLARVYRRPGRACDGGGLPPAGLRLAKRLRPLLPPPGPCCWK